MEKYELDIFIRPMFKGQVESTRQFLSASNVKYLNELVKISKANIFAYYIRVLDTQTGELTVYNRQGKANRWFKS